MNKDFATQWPLRILLAEDNPINQKVACALLGSLGYQCDLASNGVEALAALQHQPYDVVLMDMQMPEMDGLEVTRQICQQWSKSERPYIIALTANTITGDREVCLAAGMDDYISKPVRLPELEQALKGAVTARAHVVKTESLSHSFLGDFPEDEAAEIAKELLALYLEDTPQHLAALRDALHRQDFAALAAAAHSLKGSSAYIAGAERLAGLSAELEQAGQAESLDGAETLLLRIEEDFRRLRQSE